MACRRSLTTKAFLIRRWYCPSLSHIVHNSGESDGNIHSSSSKQPNCGITKYIVAQFQNQSRNSHIRSGIGSLLGYRQCNLALLPTVAAGPSFHRFMSNSMGEGSNNVGSFVDASEILTEKTAEVMSSQAPAINEVAVAAADSALPVAAVQYLIDTVHSLTGLNWWAAIAVTAILIRVATLPVLMNHQKVIYKLNLMDPRWVEIRKRLQEAGNDPIVVDEVAKELKALFKAYGVGLFTPWKAPLIRGCIFICFFLAISNMVEKVPSLTTGGALWFTDLTTPDSLCIFPFMLSLIFLIHWQLYPVRSFTGDPIKNLPRALALLVPPLTMDFPQAIFCYWIPSELFMLLLEFAIRHPEVSKHLKLYLHRSLFPADAHPQSPWASVHKRQNDEIEEEANQSLDSTEAALRKAAILKQRLRDLEKMCDGRTKDKKP